MTRTCRQISAYLSVCVLYKGDDEGPNSIRELEVLVFRGLVIAVVTEAQTTLRPAVIYCHMTVHTAAQ